MAKYYWLYSMSSEFHVTLTDDDASIADAVQAVRRVAGVEAFGYQVHREEARAGEEVIVVDHASQIVSTADAVDAPVPDADEHDLLDLLA